MLPFCGSDPLFPGQLKVLVMIADPNVQPKSRDQLLKGLFGLTPAEARVAMLLVAGLGPKEISEQMDTTQNTVRFQLKVVYRKTGVNRQSQLARLISMLPGHA
jgi:DNA-binding CsgD family transcriptional regulator